MSKELPSCNGCEHEYECVNLVCFYELLEKEKQKIRADVLREHREQCQGKCFKCEVSAHFIDADGEEVKLPYDYSYKTDCEDNRYINAKEVLSLINRARADAIDDAIEMIGNNFDFQELYLPIHIAEKLQELKEQRNE